MLMQGSAVEGRGRPAAAGSKKGKGRVTGDEWGLQPKTHRESEVLRAEGLKG
jgi:hypothetical protein